MGDGQPSVIVMDASVLMNFLRIDRLDLLARHSHGFVVTDHVAVEVADRYQDQSTGMTKPRRRLLAHQLQTALSRAQIATS